MKRNYVYNNSLLEERYGSSTTFYLVCEPQSSQQKIKRKRKSCPPRDRAEKHVSNAYKYTLYENILYIPSECLHSGSTYTFQTFGIQYAYCLQVLSGKYKSTYPCPIHPIRDYIVPRTTVFCVFVRNLSFLFLYVFYFCSRWVSSYGRTEFWSRYITVFIF